MSLAKSVSLILLPTALGFTVPKCHDNKVRCFSNQVSKARDDWIVEIYCCKKKGALCPQRAKVHGGSDKHIRELVPDGLCGKNRNGNYIRCDYRNEEWGDGSFCMNPQMSLEGDYLVSEVRDSMMRYPQPVQVQSDNGDEEKKSELPGVDPGIKLKKKSKTKKNKEKKSELPDVDPEIKLKKRSKTKKNRKSKQGTDTESLLNSNHVQSDVDDEKGGQLLGGGNDKGKGKLGKMVDKAVKALSPSGKKKKATYQNFGDWYGYSDYDYDEYYYGALQNYDGDFYRGYYYDDYYYDDDFWDNDYYARQSSRSSRLRHARQKQLLQRLERLQRKMEYYLD